MRSVGNEMQKNLSGGLIMKLSLKNMSGVAAVAVALALVGTISSAMISSIYTERRAAERAEAEKRRPIWKESRR